MGVAVGSAMHRGIVELPQPLHAARDSVSILKRVGERVVRDASDERIEHAVGR